METTGEPIQTTALAHLKLTAAQVTTGEPTQIASVTLPKIPTIAAAMNTDSEMTILAVQLATKLAAVPTMTNNA